MPKQYPVGITGIDRVLCGGIPAGRLVVIETDSDSPGEALLRRLTLQQPTLFVSTMRAETEVEKWLDGRQQLNWEEPESSSARPTDHEVPTIQIEYTGLEDPLAAATEELSRYTESANVVIDSIDSLERNSETEYLAFLQRLKEYVQETNQIAYLNVLNTTDTRDNPSNRTVTHKIADIVWEFTTNVDDQIVHRLVVTKDRTGLCSDEPFTLEIDDDITVDSSRDIAL